MKIHMSNFFEMYSPIETMWLHLTTLALSLSLFRLLIRSVTLVPATIYKREWLSLLHSTFRSPDCHQSPSEPLDQSARCCSTGSMPWGGFVGQHLRPWWLITGLMVCCLRLWWGPHRCGSRRRDDSRPLCFNGWGGFVGQHLRLLYLKNPSKFYGNVAPSFTYLSLASAES